MWNAQLCSSWGARLVHYVSPWVISLCFYQLYCRHSSGYFFVQVINNKGYDGAKADLWSCGVILFVLMAGYLPFEESNLMSLYKKVNTFLLPWIYILIFGQLFSVCSWFPSFQIFKADFTCPPWFSTSAKKLIKRILDPNPQTVCGGSFHLILSLP